MARLLPKINVDDISLKPERDVARALVKHLPQECIVYHSYPWLKPDRNNKTHSGTLKEGETDFIIILPDIGVLVLEVKGGNIEYDSENLLWHRILGNGDKKEIKDPFDQARRNMHFLKDQIRKVSFTRHNSLPFTIGYAVVFPDCTYTGPMPPGAENAIVLSAGDLPYFDRRVSDALKRWCPTDHPRPLSKSDLDGILKALSPAFKLLPVLFRKIEDQEERLFRLTEEQLRLLDFLQQNHRCAIKGVAGSGKTMLAKAQAQRFADQGLKTLMLCYNKVLANWLAASIPEKYTETISVHHFHQLCHIFCQKADIPFPIPEKSEDTTQFWQEQAPELFLQATEKYDLRFDAIVVDEGQDFFPHWWIPIEEIQKNKNGAFYLFYDPAQNLFVGEDFTIPDLSGPYILPTNCRNTRRIADICSHIRQVDIKIHKDAPEGDNVTIHVANSHEKQKQICRQVIGEWVTKGNLVPSQIVIQSPYTRKKSSINDLNAIKNISITEDTEKWKNNEGVLYSTIRSFKGLEADAVIVTDVPAFDAKSHFSRSDLYVACSRAKHLLTILPFQEEGFLEPVYQLSPNYT